MNFLKKYNQFLVLWIVNIALLYLANKLFPLYYTLGNNLFTPMQAAVFSGLIWNWVLWNAGSELKKFELDTKSAMGMMLEYLAINFVTVWLIARFAYMTGFGVASFLYVFGLAFVANFVQYKVWTAVDAKGKK